MYLCVKLKNMNGYLMTFEQRNIISLVHRFPEMFKDFIIEGLPDNLPNNFLFDFGLMECWIEINPDGNVSVTKEKPDTTNKLLFTKKVVFSKYMDLYSLTDMYEQKKPRFPGTNLT